MRARRSAGQGSDFIRLPSMCTSVTLLVKRSSSRQNASTVQVTLLPPSLFTTNESCSSSPSRLGALKRDLEVCGRDPFAALDHQLRKRQFQAVLEPLLHYCVYHLNIARIEHDACGIAVLEHNLLTGFEGGQGQTPR